MAGRMVPTVAAIAVVPTAARTTATTMLPLPRPRDRHLGMAGRRMKWINRHHSNLNNRIINNIIMTTININNNSKRRRRRRRRLLRHRHHHRPNQPRPSHHNHTIMVTVRLVHPPSDLGNVESLSKTTRRKMYGTRNGGCHAFLMHLRILYLDVEFKKRSRRMIEGEKERGRVRCVVVCYHKTKTEPFMDY